MVKRRMGIMAVVICYFLCLMPCTALAAYTSDANEPILTDHNCTLTISYRCDGVAFSNLPVKLYKIADVSADAQYKLESDFAASGLILNGIQTNGEWNVICTTLETHILANNIDPMLTDITDNSGVVDFDGLKPGLYMLSAQRVNQEVCAYYFDSALVALPGINTEGIWQYDISVAAKPEVLPPTVPEDDISFKILKLWKGDEGRIDRPVRIEVEIFCDGNSYETVILSEENLWSYGWTAKDNGATWKVVEQNVPKGYTMTLEERGTTFVLTNTRIPEDPETPPVNPPKTGDTSNVLVYTALILVSGAMLIVLGIIGKKRCHENTI